MKLDIDERELSFLAAVIYLGAAVLDSDSVKIEDAVTMLKLGREVDVFTALDVLSTSRKVQNEIDAFNVRRVRETPAAPSLKLH